MSSVLRLISSFVKVLFSPTSWQPIVDYLDDSFRGFLKSEMQVLLCFESDLSSYKLFMGLFYFSAASCPLALIVSSTATTFLMVACTAVCTSSTRPLTGTSPSSPSHTSSYMIFLHNPLTYFRREGVPSYTTVVRAVVHARLKPLDIQALQALQHLVPLLLLSLLCPCLSSPHSLTLTHARSTSCPSSARQTCSPRRSLPPSRPR